MAAQRRIDFNRDPGEACGDDAAIMPCRAGLAPLLFDPRFAADERSKLRSTESKATTGLHHIDFSRDLGEACGDNAATLPRRAGLAPLPFDPRSADERSKLRST